MKRLLPWVLASLIIGYFGIIFYANHGIYFSHFDPSYWKGRFDHSQWQLPQSERGIGDDGLYAYGGYILSQGADPAGFNAEMPPLGKYMIGFTIVLFRNGQLYGLITMTIAIGIFFLCAKLLLRDTVRALSATLILALDPLITSQFAITMLESGQLLFLLLLCLGLSQKKYHAVFLGLVFGAFSAIKFPLVSPLICMGIIALIWQKTKRVAPIFLFLAASIVAYLSAYLRYFSLGHTLINWLGVQKWIVNFYLHANLLPNFGSFVTALTTGWIQNFFTRGWERATEWSPVWPFIFLATLSWGLVYWKKYLAITSMMMLAIVLYSVIPFWIRYLVLFLPIFYLVTVAIISSRAKQWFPILIGIIILTNGAASLRILFPTPQTAVNQFLFDWKHGFFQDMYEQVSSDTQQAISREAFHSIGFQTFLDGQIEKVEITSDPVAWSRFRSPQTVPLNITYTTRNLGPFTERISLSVVREQNRWRIPWKWGLLINNLTDNTKLETIVQQAKRGSIIANDGDLLAQDIPSVLVSVVPEKIDSKQEEAMLKFLEIEFDQRVAAIGLYRRYRQNNLSDQPVALGVFMKRPNDATLVKLLSFPGLRLTPWFGRIKKGDPPDISIGTVANTLFFECCSLLYNATAYNGISGLEKEYNDVLRGENGGTLVIKDQNGAIIRILIDKEKQDGRTASTKFVP